jgi:hypothetical protein
VLKRALVILSVVGLPAPALAQGPIFLTPANTTPVSDVAPSVSYVRKGDETDLNLQASYGVRPALTLGVGMLMVADAGGPLEVGRVQAQVKFRLIQKVGDGKRTVVGLGTGLGLPFGGVIDRVARDNGLSYVVGSFTAAHVERRMGFFAGTQYTFDLHNDVNLHTATAGAAASWRFKPAPPGATSGPGFTLFFETLGHYEGDHSGWFAVAPGVMYRIGRTQMKLGVRLPVKRWNSSSSPMLSLGTSMFIPVKPSRR